jgi:hypothetical protein
VQHQTERERSAVRHAAVGELALSSEAQYPSDGRVYWRRVGVKFRATYLGRPLGLRSGKTATVFIEDERTR